MTTSLSHKISGYFLVILFCGYFGSITLFPHSHIVNGVTIVHSHPFKSDQGNAPVNHSHTTNGFQLIQLISGFIATTTIFFIATTVLRKVSSVRFPVQDEFLRVRLNISSPNRPRGPTLISHN